MPNTRRVFKLFFSTIIILFLFLCFKNHDPLSGTVNIWLTTSDQSQELAPQLPASFTTDAGGSTPTITVDDNTTFQVMDGFGYTFTEGSAELINSMSTTQQNALLNDIYNPTTGIGCSIIRLSIGASDLSSSVYSYDDQSSPDLNMNYFSLAGPDLTYLIPLLKKVLLINPNIQIIAVPWSAPSWMKSNDYSSGGSLNSGDYSAYATYFVKYLQAMQAQGINIWAITPQNEPENTANNPSMSMTSDEETNFINNYLGPAVRSAGFTAKIIAYDHNCDDTAYPIAVLNNSTYAEGASFHLYAGDISALSTVHNATGKNVYFTEQFTSTTGNFGGDLSWHVQNVVIGSAENWSKVILEWNLAIDPNGNPHTNNGCSDCLGAVTVNNSTTYTRNVAYYIISHVSKFVHPGAVRISSNNANSILSAAFKNLDGTIAVVALNTGSSSTFKIKWGTQSFTYNLAGGAVASFVWNSGSNTSCSVNNWTGAINNAWENPANWSCGIIPVDTTVVDINPGLLNYPVVNSKAVCKTLYTSPGASVNVNTGFSLNVAGHN
jgi:glucosylceramidase